VLVLEVRSDSDPSILAKIDGSCELFAWLLPLAP